MSRRGFLKSIAIAVGAASVPGTLSAVFEPEPLIDFVKLEPSVIADFHWEDIWREIAKLYAVPESHLSYKNTTATEAQHSLNLFAKGLSEFLK